MQTDIKITRSNGKGKNGVSYCYIRPVEKCSNKSRRCRVEDIEKCIQKYFAPKIRVFEIEGLVICAPDLNKAFAEYNRVCPKNMIGKAKKHIEITYWPIMP